MYFTEDGKINENAPKEFFGLDRFEARKKLIKLLIRKRLFCKRRKYKK